MAFPPMLAARSRVERLKQDFVSAKAVISLMRFASGAEKAGREVNVVL